MRKFWILKMIIIGAIAISAFGYAVMLLWNGLIPDLFHGPVIGFLQAIGLLILAKFLFSGMSTWRGGHSWRRQHWRERMQEKMNAMTPEEREKFRDQWQRRCGGFGMRNKPVSDAPETKTA